MSMIFQGMDPYLEEPILWHSFHQQMVVYLAETLQPLLLPRYVASVESRGFIETPDDRVIYPDVLVRRHHAVPAPAAATAIFETDSPVEIELPDLEINESYIQILDLRSGQEVVTVIEVVSPTNKYAGHGRTSYVTKQREVRASRAHLVEIDLLRYGPHVLAIPESVVRRRGDYDYLASVNRAVGTRSRFQYYAWSLRQRVPPIRIPLANGDEDVLLDLRAVLDRTYSAGAYVYQIRYDRPCMPPLSPEDQAWADELIRKAHAAASQ